VIFGQPVECMVPQVFGHARRMPDAYDLLIFGHQTRQQIVDRRIAGSASQNTLPLLNRLHDQFDHGCRFSSSRRAMNDGQIIGREISGGSGWKVGSANPIRMSRSFPSRPREFIAVLMAAS